MLYNISYENNTVYQTILVDAPSMEIAERYFQSRKPYAHICGTKEATRDDMRPGKPVMTVSIEEVTRLLAAEQQNQNALPDMCYTVPMTTGELVVLKNGEKGYYPCTWSTPNVEENKAKAKDFNERLGVTEAQVKAMEFGSMFGFDKPGANPAIYEKKTLQDQIRDAQSKAGEHAPSAKERSAPEQVH